MHPFKILHGFFLHSEQKLMGPNTIHTPKTEASAEELRKFAVDGACEEMTPKTPEEPAVAPVSPTDDITVVPGTNKKNVAALNALGITTKSGLKDKIGDAAVKEALADNYDKIAKYFSDSPAI